MKRIAIAIALAAIGLLGIGARKSEAQFFGGGFQGGFNPYGYGGMSPYGYGGYGNGGYGYAWTPPQTYNQLGFLAGTVDQVTRQPRSFRNNGFPSRGVRRGRHR